MMKRVGYSYISCSWESELLLRFVWAYRSDSVLLGNVVAFRFTLWSYVTLWR